MKGLYNTAIARDRWHLYMQQPRPTNFNSCSFDAIKRWSTRANTLTLLSVSKIPPQTDSVTVDDWLDLLSYLPCLEYLHIHDTIRRSTDVAMHSLRHPSRRVFLPRLNTIICKSIVNTDISLARDGFAALILHLATPWNTRVCMDRMGWRLAHIDAFMNDLRDMLHCLDLRRAAVLDPADSSLHRREYQTATLTYYGPASLSRMQVTLAFSEAHDLGDATADDDLLTVPIPAFSQTLHHVPDTLLIQLLTTPLLSGVKTLRLRDIAVPAAVWTALASAHPHIASVHITEIHSLVALVDVLESGATGSVVFPDLRRLTLALAPPEPGLSGALLPCASGERPATQEDIGEGPVLLQRLADVLASRTERGLGMVDVDTGEGCADVDATDASGATDSAAAERAVVESEAEDRVIDERGEDE